MTDLLGAWSLSGASVDRLLPHPVRAHLMRQLVGSTQDDVLAGRLWLVASTGKLVRREGDVAAWEGFVADGLGPQVTAGRAIDDKHEGHYVMVEHAGQRLRLLRALSGGERLYVAKLDGLVLFSASIRPLLAHPEIHAALDPAVTDEVLITGHPLFGPQTPITGILEVQPGHVATLGDDGQLHQQWHWPEALQSPPGDPKTVARMFRDALCTAVERSVGKQRPVALALSGGIDSSAIAAAAVEVVGASQVHAFTYEFDDETHAPPETRYAQLVARALGIGRHDVFRIRAADFLDGIVEHVWRSESAVHWPKAFLLPVARTIASYGYDRYLTGFGIGSHMGYLRELGRALPFIPFPNRSLRYWRRVRFDAWDWLRHLAKLHPGLEPPHPRLYDLLLQVLERRGLIDDHRDFYPVAMRPLLERRRGALASIPDLTDPSVPLGEALQRHAFAHLISCVDVTRSEKASREVGLCRVSPAHFAGSIPFAYFPVAQPPFVWSRDRHLRPGKYLLRLAYRGVVPDEVLFRRKSWDDAVSSRTWRKRGRVFMLRALPGYPYDLDLLGTAHPDAVEHWEPTSIQASCLSFWFWRELFVRRSVGRAPPTWPDLWGYTPEQITAGRRQ